MNIFITNDDGYEAQGIKVLAKLMKQFGRVTVIAPKEHQSGMAMAVSLGKRDIDYCEVESPVEGVKWGYLGASPSTCVKYAINYAEDYPDVVLSGINHGSNAAVASCYSGTLGAAQEAVVNRIPGIGVSLDTLAHEADFGCVEAYFPEIFRRLVDSFPSGRNVFYNINFPNLPASGIKGVKVTSMGLCRWIKEFCPNPDGTYHMRGDIEDWPTNRPDADHHLIAEGYITITPHLLDNTDYVEMDRLNKIF